MAAEVDKVLCTLPQLLSSQCAHSAMSATQQANGSNGVAPATLDGLGDKTLADNATVGQAAGEAAPVKSTAPELATATAEPVAPPAPVLEKEEPKLAEAGVTNPGEAPPAPVSEKNKVVENGLKPVEQTAPAQIEKPTEAPPASASVEAPSEPAPAPANEKPLETADTPAVVSEVLKANGTVATNGTTTTSKEHEDVEMKDAPAASSAVESTAASAVPPADSAAEKPVATEPEPEAVVGEKRKAEEEPAANDALEGKKVKFDETPTDADAEANKPAALDAAPAPAPITTTTTDNTSVSAADSVPRKAGRPKKTQKEKVPVSPVGRTLRKTRSQGPVGV
ncbi:hypothetical protein V8F33_010018 [Rhypophila sp. PSN 637]